MSNENDIMCVLICLVVIVVGVCGCVFYFIFFLIVSELKNMCIV